MSAQVSLELHHRISQFLFHEAGDAANLLI